uniref:Uncharacterized protein n=1 Tax=Anguilla anguilla TaxID=7936 RepID=A0A0E9WDJ3_ANGAN
MTETLSREKCKTNICCYGGPRELFFAFINSKLQ